MVIPFYLLLRNPARPQLQLPPVSPRGLPDLLSPCNPLAEHQLSKPTLRRIFPQEPAFPRGKAQVPPNKIRALDCRWKGSICHILVDSLLCPPAAPSRLRHSDTILPSSWGPPQVCQIPHLSPRLRCSQIVAFSSFDEETQQLCNYFRSCQNTLFISNGVPGTIFHSVWQSLCSISLTLVLFFSQVGTELSFTLVVKNTTRWIDPDLDHAFIIHRNHATTTL